MAIFNGSSKFNSHIVFALDVHEEGTSVTENVSYIGWRLIGYMDDSGTSSHWYSYEQNTGYVNINGITVWSVDKGAKQSIGTQNRSSNPAVIASGKATFAHNADGSKSINAAFSFGPTWNAKITGSGTLKLSNIPRASSFTLSLSSVEFGGKFNCTITSASSSFRHILKFVATGLGTQTVKSDMGSGTITDITVPSDWMKYCTNSDSMSVTPMLETYNNGTRIGTKSGSAFTIKVPSNIVPNCSVSVSDTTSYNSKYGGYVQGKSTAKVTVNASGTNGSTIKSITSYIGGNTYNGNANYFCSKSGQITYSGKAVDSRGRSKSSSSGTFTVLPYSNPSGSLSLKRVTSTSDNTANENGSAAVITYSYNISSLNSKNSKHVTIWNGDNKIKEITNSYSGSESITIDAPSTSSLTIKMYVSDDFNSGIVYTASIPSAFRLINFNNSGRGIAFGKYSEDNDFDVNMDARFRKAVRCEDDVIAGLGTSNHVSLQGLSTAKVNIIDIINNLTSTATNKPLSANQGKVLNDRITSTNGNISNINNKINANQGKCFLAVNQNSSTTFSGKGPVLIYSTAIKLYKGNYIAIAIAIIKTSRYTSNLRLNVAGKDIGMGITNSQTAVPVSIMGHFEIDSEKQTAIALRAYGQDSGTTVTVPAYSSYSIIIFKIG